MVTRIMKWVSLVALLLALIWRFSTSFQIVFEFVISLGAVLVVIQAVRAGKYVWGTGFVAITVLFNPIAPLVFSRTIFLWLVCASIAMFLASLAALKNQPLLTVPSIMNRNPGRESL